MVDDATEKELWDEPADINECSMTLHSEIMISFAEIPFNCGGKSQKWGRHRGNATGDESLRATHSQHEAGTPSAHLQPPAGTRWNATLRKFMGHMKHYEAPSGSLAKTLQ